MALTVAMQAYVVVTGLRCAKVEPRSEIYIVTSRLEAPNQRAPVSARIDASEVQLVDIKSRLICSIRRVLILLRAWQPWPSEAETDVCYGDGSYY